jgi:hypothetical protein
VISSAARAVFIALLVAAIVPPYVSIAGPLSLDDLFPLLGVTLGLAAAAFCREELVDDPSLAAFAVLGALGLVSSAANSGRTGEFLWLAARSTGRAVFYISLIVSARLVLRDPVWLRRAIHAFAALATLEALFCIWAYVAGYHGPFGFGLADVPTWWTASHGHGRVHGTFAGQTGAFEQDNTSSNFLAAYLLLTIPSTAGIAIGAEGRAGRTTRVVAALAALAQVAALYLTYTRAALVALALAALLMGWLLGRRRLVAALVTIGLVSALATPSVRARLGGESHDRFALWWSGARIAADHPLFGVGDGYYLPVLFHHQRYYDTPFGTSTSTSHNSVLLSAANLGLLGGAAHALLYALMLWVSWRAIRDAEGPARALAIGLVCGLAGYLVQDQFNNLAYVPKVATQMWFVFALIPLLPGLAARRVSA